MTDLLIKIQLTAAFLTAIGFIILTAIGLIIALVNSSPDPFYLPKWFVCLGLFCFVIFIVNTLTVVLELIWLD